MKKILSLIFVVLVVAFSASAQITDLKSSFNLTSDTVTNTATGYLQATALSGAKGVASIQIVITKISGTVAGTITLQGSNDGTNFIALTNTSTVPQIATATATDVASQTFGWTIGLNVWRYYRVSWTGAGTMSARFTGKLHVR